MPNHSLPKHNADTIADALRKRICLEPPTESPLLHEQALAADFSVSRTPVRQALQRLAYERLVEVRSGVGTMVSPLHPDGRATDLALARALLDVAAQIEGDRALSQDTKSRILTLDHQVQAAQSLDLDANYTIRATALGIVAAEVSNDILAEALKAALWRVCRWRMAEAAAAPSGIDAPLREVIAAMAAATNHGTVRALLVAQHGPLS